METDMKRSIPFAMLALMTVSPASASGGVWCDANDSHMTISIHAPMTRSGGVYTLKGVVRFKQPSVPAELRNLEFGHEHLSRFAISARDASMTLRRELPTKPELVELEIEVSGEEGEYQGQYSAIVHNGNAQPKAARIVGAILCGAD
jgi:hypothetical protein